MADIIEVKPGDAEGGQVKEEVAPEGTTVTQTESGGFKVETNQPTEYVRPEKFKTEQDLYKSYAELEKKYTEVTSGKEPTPTKEEGKKDLKISELSGDDALQPFYDEYESSQGLTDDSFGKLEKLGYPKHLVERFMEGQMSLQNNARVELENHAGGSKSLDIMREWARANYSGADLLAYNKAIDSGDMSTAKMALDGLKSKYVAANGDNANLIQGGKPTPEEGYRSQAEMTAAMKDPRYDRDEAYRSDVQRKVESASFLNPTRR